MVVQSGFIQSIVRNEYRKEPKGRGFIVECPLDCYHDFHSTGGRMPKPKFPSAVNARITRH